MSPAQLNNWMAQHRRTVYAAAAILVILALLGGLYYIGWLKETGNTEHRKYFKPPPGEGLKYLPGERLEYRAVLTRLGVSKDAGTIEINVDPLAKQKDGSVSYRITYTVESSEAVSAVYVMKGQVVAIVDAETLLPLEFEAKMRTGLAIKGAEYKHKRLVYNRDTNKVEYYRAIRGSKDRTPVFIRSRQVPPDAQHFSSLFYFIRFVDFKSGEEVLIPMSDRKRDMTIKASVLREKDYEAFDGTTRKAIVLKTVTDFGKEEMEGAAYRIWLDKKDRYPVRIKADVEWGKVDLKLVKRTVKEAPAGASK